MQGFQNYLIEDRNTHLEHLEDEIINNGTKGAKTSIEFLKSIKKMLQGGSGGSTVSVKWDGAPAVFCGINPKNSENRVRMYFMEKKDFEKHMGQKAPEALNPRNMVKRYLENPDISYSTRWKLYQKEELN